MTLYLIGIGLGYAKDITLRGLEIVKKCDSVILEGYTSIFQDSIGSLERLCGKRVKIADRGFIEERFNVEDARDKDIAILIIGDVFSATTHFALLSEAKKKNIAVNVINNASIINAVGIVGLSLYKYGKVVSIPFPEKSFFPKDFYNTIEENKRDRMHTLCLLDIKAEKNIFMKINEAIEILLNLEKEFKRGAITSDTLCIGVARLGREDYKIKAGKASQLLKEDFGRPPHSLIIPASLDHVEEESLNLWK